MKDIEASLERFNNDLGMFLRDIQVVRIVDPVAFQKVVTEAVALATFLKPQLLVPKSLLNRLRVATKVLRAEAQYIAGGQNDLPAMADKLEMIFDLILIGETPEDRIPGVPRIV